MNNIKDRVKGALYGFAIGAVNHGGDADTIAGIAGSIAGAKFGYENIPKRWVEKLDKEVVKKLEKFLEYVFKTYLFEVIY